MLCVNTHAGRRARRASSLFLALLIAPAVSYAQPESLEVRENRAVALRSEGRTQEALEVFREVFEAGHLPRTQARLGLAETALGRWVSAEHDLQTALGAASDPFISANRAALETTLATVRAHLGSLEVLCPQHGAEVWIEGRLAASLPLTAPMRVAAGSTPMEIRAEGYYPVVRTVTVAPGQIVRESVELMPVRTIPVQAIREVAAPQGALRVTPLPVTTPVEEPGGRGHTRRVAGWWTLGGAALMAVGGGVALGVQRNVGSQFNADCSAMYDDELSADCASRRSSANTAGALAVTGLAVGGALAVVAAVLLFPTTSTSNRRATALCGAGPGTLGVSCSATF